MEENTSSKSNSSDPHHGVDGAAENPPQFVGMDELPDISHINTPRNDPDAHDDGIEPRQVDLALGVLHDRSGARVEGDARLAILYV